MALIGDPLHEVLPETSQGPAEPFSTVLHFDYLRPPLSANQRLHWRTKAKITRDVRTATRLLAHRIPDLVRCRVSLTWFVADRRRRDADNLVPTLKVMCDGLVDAGICRDDTPDLMVKTMPTIEHVQGAAHMELRIEGLL